VQSHRWRRAAVVPEATFEAWVGKTRAAGDELTSAGLLRLAESIIATQEATLSLSVPGIAATDTPETTLAVVSPGVVAKEEPAPAARDSYISIVQLSLTVAQKAPFLARVAALQAIFGTRTATETIVMCVDRAYAALRAEADVA
jgi:hypothetical protein